MSEHGAAASQQTSKWSSSLHSLGNQAIRPRGHKNILSNGVKGRFCCRPVSNTASSRSPCKTSTEQPVQGSKSVRNRPSAQNLRSWSTDKFERQELQVDEAFCSLCDPSRSTVLVAHPLHCIIQHPYPSHVSIFKLLKLQS